MTNVYAVNGASNHTPVGVNPTNGLASSRRDSNGGGGTSSGPSATGATASSSPAYAISGTLTPEQLDAYALNTRIDDISRRLRTGDVVPEGASRSPSPPPQYDTQGRRTNTRELRYRARLEDERHKLIDRASRTIPNYRPPVDYRRTHKTQEKIYIPVHDYPQINFIGLLIGPRGRTLKKMEEQSGAKIAIRGKGSVKEGKGANARESANNGTSSHANSMEEDLHCLIIADSEEKTKRAIDLVNSVIETAASIPEGQNELKRDQLRELAALNGTLRDDEGQTCQICGEHGHRRYDCPQRRVQPLAQAAQVTCRVCGGVGHFARDCKERRGSTHGPHSVSPPLNVISMPSAPALTGAQVPAQAPVSVPAKSSADSEYEQLMRELGNGLEHELKPAAMTSRAGSVSSASSGHNASVGVPLTSAAPSAPSVTAMNNLGALGGGRIAPLSTTPWPNRWNPVAPVAPVSHAANPWAAPAAGSSSSTTNGFMDTNFDASSGRHMQGLPQGMPQGVHGVQGMAMPQGMPQGLPPGMPQGIPRSQAPPAPSGHVPGPPGSMTAPLPASGPNLGMAPPGLGPPGSGRPPFPPPPPPPPGFHQMGQAGVGGQAARPIGPPPTIAPIGPPGLRVPPPPPATD